VAVLSYVVQIGALGYWMGLLCQYMGMDLNRVVNAPPVQAEAAEGPAVPAADLDAPAGQGQVQAQVPQPQAPDEDMLTRLHRVYLEGMGVPTAPGLLMDLTAVFMSFFLSIVPTWKPYA
jgi:hypothetical protein